MSPLSRTPGGHFYSDNMSKTLPLKADRKNIDCGGVRVRVSVFVCVDVFEPILTLLTLAANISVFLDQFF